MKADRATYEAVLAARVRAATPTTDLNGSEPPSATSTGSFTSAGDSRLLASSTAYILADRSSWSFSFIPETLTCHTCIKNKGHHILHPRQTNRSSGSAFILSDHTFPACLPSTDEKACVKVIRLEYGSPRELVKKFDTLFKNVSIPANSIILLGTPSYLERVGATRYTSEMAEAFMHIKKMEKGLRYNYLPPVLASGSNCPRLIRELLDVTAWLKEIAGQDETFSGHLYKTSIDVMLELGIG